MTHWTKEREALLRLMWAEGRSGSEIVKSFGGEISRSAVHGKVRRLNLSARPRPPAVAKYNARRRVVWSSKMIAELEECAAKNMTCRATARQMRLSRGVVRWKAECLLIKFGSGKRGPKPKMERPFTTPPEVIERRRSEAQTHARPMNVAVIWDASDPLQNPTGCLWIEGETDVPGWRYCQRSVVANVRHPSWCAHHRSIVFRCLEVEAEAMREAA